MAAVSATDSEIPKCTCLSDFMSCRLYILYKYGVTTVILLNFTGSWYYKTL